MADVIVTLHVDTSKISEKNVDSCSNFGQEPGISNEDFSTLAKVGDTIIWKGVSSSTPETDIVNITKVHHHSGNNVFKEDNMKGHGHPEKVSAAVKKDTNGNHETYTLFFTVYNGEKKRGGQYHIDPKLAINP
ncbi:hypothetical protein [Flavobacterium degerlachei]|jgi:hypothetical protein|uniref:Inclusion body protein n=1 Tax=Flavobacterium degerlachei TaxID=229203 RepID=A0A1H2SFR8_9FLAO|nr:hypothetical protein [Flavobacterium degerlachei]SDW30533.1 hypothetical protein SAMN05444338_10269 [Flavobacterium degerlachei]